MLCSTSSDTCAPAGRASRLGEGMRVTPGAGLSQPCRSSCRAMAIRCSVSVCLQRPLCQAWRHAQGQRAGCGGPKARATGRRPADRRSFAACGRRSWVVRGLSAGYLPVGPRCAWSALHQVRPFCSSASERADGCRSARSAPWRAAAGLGGRLGRRNRARVARRRHAGGDAGHAQHRDDDDDPEQQLAHVQPRCRIISSTNRLPV